MKTNELVFLPINNADEAINEFYEAISKEPQIEIPKKEDWLGEFIYQIYDTKQGVEVGYISFSRWDTTYCLSCVYVHEQFRHLGIATAAIRKLINKLKTYKPDLIYGFVEKNNRIAITLYQNVGFKFLTIDRMGYKVTNPNEKECVVENNFYEFGMHPKD